MGAGQPLGGEIQQGFKLDNHLDPLLPHHPLQSRLTENAASTGPIQFAENEPSLGLERERHLSAPAATFFRGPLCQDPTHLDLGQSC